MLANTAWQRWNHPSTHPNNQVFFVFFLLPKKETSGQFFLLYTIATCKNKHFLLTAGSQKRQNLLKPPGHTRRMIDLHLHNFNKQLTLALFFERQVRNTHTGTHGPTLLHKTRHVPPLLLNGLICALRKAGRACSICLTAGHAIRCQDSKEPRRSLKNTDLCPANPTPHTTDSHLTNRYNEVCKSSGTE